MSSSELTTAERESREDVGALSRQELEALVDDFLTYLMQVERITRARLEEIRRVHPYVQTLNLWAYLWDYSLREY